MGYREIFLRFYMNRDDDRFDTFRIYFCVQWLTEVFE